MKPHLTVSAHPQRYSQKLLIGLGMKLQKAVGLWQSGPLPDACGIHLSKQILPCRNWALEFNLLATLMQKESENGTQEIPADSFIWKWSEHIQRRLSPWIYRKAEHQFLCFFTSFFKWMPGELQSLIIFLHLKLIRFVLPQPPPTPHFSTSIYFFQSTVNEKKSVYCTIWHLAAEVAGVFGYQSHLLLNWNLLSTHCHADTLLECSSRAQYWLSSHSQLFSSEFANQLHPVVFLLPKKKNKKHHPFHNPIYPWNILVWLCILSQSRGEDKARNGTWL